MKFERSIRRSLLVAIPLFTILAIGCGGGGGGGSSTTTGLTSSTSTSSTSSTTGSSSFTVAYVGGTSNAAETLDVQQGLATPTAVASGQSYFGPALSPDKSQVAVIQSAQGGTTNDIFVYKTSGANQSGTQLTHIGNVDGTTILQGPSLAWNPQGTKILFFEEDASLWEITSTGGSAIQIAPATPATGTYRLMPRWSPDGSKICYVQGANLYVVNADGSNQQLLYTLPSGNNGGATKAISLGA